MQIFHIYYNDWTKKQRATLAKASIQPVEGFSRIDIEVNEHTRPILKVIEGWKVQRSVGTLFEKKDLESTSLYVYMGIWELGYPQPEDDFGYINVTYDTSSYCRECGIGAVQKAPFYIRKQPVWRKNEIFELNWVHDELFVSRDIYETVFKKHGLSKWPVLQYKKNIELQDTFQLKIPLVDASSNLEGYETEECPVCGAKKFNPQLHGYVPGFKEPVPDIAIFKTREYFGSGGAAYHRIYIRKPLLEELKKAGQKLNIAPVDPTSIAFENEEFQNLRQP